MTGRVPYFLQSDHILCSFQFYPKTPVGIETLKLQLIPFTDDVITFSFITGKDVSGLKAFICSSDWWDHSAAIGRLSCHMVQTY